MLIRNQVLRQENVQYVVAPYEADAQLVFLALNRHVDFVITEDSDLIVYGCPQVALTFSKYKHKVERRSGFFIKKYKTFCFARLKSHITNSFLLIHRRSVLF